MPTNDTGIEQNYNETEKKIIRVYIKWQLVSSSFSNIEMNGWMVGWIKRGIKKNNNNSCVDITVTLSVDYVVGIFFCYQHLKTKRHKLSIAMLLFLYKEFLFKIPQAKETLQIIRMIYEYG